MTRALFLLAFAGCAADAVPPITDSCAKQRSWSSAVDCGYCRARALEPKCDCAPDPAGGACRDAVVDLFSNCPSCASCGADCACLASCATGACASRAASVEACLVRACDARCK